MAVSYTHLDVYKRQGVLYRRLRDGGESFTIKEMLAIEKVLNISQAEFHNIFFE